MTSKQARKQQSTNDHCATDNHSANTTSIANTIDLLLCPLEALAKTTLIMAMPYIDTPRTEFADHTRLSAGDLDNFTENSIPSPSKDGNDLLKQIKAMRGPSLQTPRSRAPFGNRRNVQKNEFTPLLKSAATNRFMRSAMYNQENATPLKTPAGLKAGYSVDSPALPLNSSIIREEYTGSPMGPDDGSRTPQAPAPSSSAMSTPVALMAKVGDGPLENRGNLATLREQEAVCDTEVDESDIC